MVLILTRGGSTMRVPLRLPASPSEEMEAFERLDTISTNMSATRVAEAVSPIPNLARYIKNVYFDGSNYEKLKQLAERLDPLTETEQHIFNGALEAENVCGLDDILDIADHLEDYELNEDVICDRDLGGWLVQHDVLGISFPETVRPYLDYVAIGAEYYKSCQRRFEIVRKRRRNFVGFRRGGD